MLAFILNVMATIVYAVAASLLLAKIRVKAALHFSPSIPFRCLIYSLLALGALYLLRVIFFYRGQGIPGIYLKEDHYLRITFTCLPIYCITFTSIASKSQKSFIEKKLMFLPGYMHYSFSWQYLSRKNLQQVSCFPVLPVRCV